MELDGLDTERGGRLAGVRVPGDPPPAAFGLGEYRLMMTLFPACARTAMRALSFLARIVKRAFLWQLKSILLCPR